LQSGVLDRKQAFDIRRSPAQFVATKDIVLPGLRCGDVPRMKYVYISYLANGHSAARFYDVGWCNEQLSADRIVAAKVDID